MKIKIHLNNGETVIDDTSVAKTINEFIVWFAEQVEKQCEERVTFPLWITGDKKIICANAICYFKEAK